MGRLKLILAFVSAGFAVLGSSMAIDAFPKWFCVLSLALSTGSGGVLTLISEVPQDWINRFVPKAPGLTVVTGGASEPENGA